MCRLIHGKALDFVPLHVDPTRVAGVEFEEVRVVRFPEQLAGEGLLQNHDEDVAVVAGSTTGHEEVIGVRQQSAGDWDGFLIIVSCDIGLWNSTGGTCVVGTSSLYHSGVPGREDF